MIAKVNQLWLK